MRSVLIIDNFNYAPFLPEAVESALKQTLPFDQIVVVDDGSTDASRDYLATLTTAQPSLRVILKENGGQLSAFIAGLEAVGSADFVYFLDADDRLKPEHHATLEEQLKIQPALGMICSSFQEFGAQNRTITLSRDHGLTAIPALFEQSFIGNITSSLGFRRQYLEVLLPVMRELAPAWRTRADDCLVLGASLAGAYKRQIAAVTVEYRIHDANAFARSEFSFSKDYQHHLRRLGYVNRVAEHLGLNSSILQRAAVEYFSAPDRDSERKRTYLRILRRARMPLLSKVKNLLKILRDRPQ